MGNQSSSEIVYIEIDQWGLKGILLLTFSFVCIDYSLVIYLHVYVPEHGLFRGSYGGLFLSPF